MDSGHGKRRINVEDDRLSSLPDELIHKILSSFKIRDVIYMSVLSSRWRFVWTSLPYLHLSIEDFSKLPKFSKFVTNVLSRRNNLAEVYSMKLRIRVKASHAFIKRILNYAFSHNVQQLNVTCLLENDNEFPLSLFRSQSLKHLSLTMQNGCFTSTWELPTLTTLDLHSFSLCDDNCNSVISKCANLKNLTINQFKKKGSNDFNIIHPQLSNLTLENDLYGMKVINVVAPQLQKLTIRNCFYLKHLTISAPDLVSLLYKGRSSFDLCTKGFRCLEKADICVSTPQRENAHQIVSLLQHLHNVKYLTLNLEIVEILCSCVDLILKQPSPFVNLKSLNIYPEIKAIWLMQAEKKVTIMSTELKSYLLDGSPDCTVTMVLREEIQAHDLLAELRVLLKKENANFRTKRAHQEQHELKKLEIFGENMKTCWEDLIMQLQQRKEKACEIISKLQNIEKLLTKLPETHIAKIQPSFSSLCAEAHVVISKITDGMKIECDENQTRLSFLFQNELATTL